MEEVVGIFEGNAVVHANQGNVHSSNTVVLTELKTCLLYTKYLTARTTTATNMDPTQETRGGGRQTYQIQTKALPWLVGLDL